MLQVQKEKLFKIFDDHSMKEWEEKNGVVNVTTGDGERVIILYDGSARWQGGKFDGKEL